MMILFSFGRRGDAPSTSPFNHPQCPFIQMADTDVTFPPNYSNMDLARLYVMILNSPPSLPPGSGQGWVYLSNFLNVPGYKKLTTEITLLPDFKNWMLPAHTLRSLPPLPESPVSPLTLDRAGLRVYLPPRTPRLRGCQSPHHSRRVGRSFLNSW
jgi:hypothetical protein